jgi:hypothetical protein
MRRLIVGLVVTFAGASLMVPGAASGDAGEYGLESVGAAVSTSQAGGHPDFSIDFALKTENEDKQTLPATTRDVSFDIPPGLVANPTAVPECTEAQLVGTDVEDKSNATGCPQASQVGITEVILCKFGCAPFLEPVYNLQPGLGEPARFGFMAESFPVLIHTELRPAEGYSIRARAEGLSSLIPVLSADTTLWGVPALESHDAQRITPYEATHNGGAPETANGKRRSELVPVPFMVNPTSCNSPSGIGISARSYALPDRVSTAFAPLPAFTGCGQLEFSPAFALVTTSESTSSPTGLDALLNFSQNGFEHPNGLVQSAQRRVEVALPEGFTVNPSQANGLGACDEAQFAAETADSAAGGGCPENSKIGDVEARTPLLDESAKGSLFIARPYANPFGSLIALYMTLKIPDRGVIVTLAGKVEADADTGQLTAIFDGIPQLPISEFKLSLHGGARAPLVTPSSCGTYRTVARFTPWADTARVTPVSGFLQISGGAEGTPCSEAGHHFEPGFVAGSSNNHGGAFTPFYMQLSRLDRDQELTKFSVRLPHGLVAKLAGVARCPESAIGAARRNRGTVELARPSCPSTSDIGSILAAAGVGPAPTYVGGRLYLSGPFRGAPLSITAVVPAVAGPFDLGTVVTQLVLRIDPRTGVATVGGGQSDPIPRILDGIPLKVKDIRSFVDRNQFVINPTNCDPLSVAARIWGSGLNVLEPADDTAAPAVDRFQAQGCQRLKFRPALGLRLIGKTNRGGHPSLRGIYRPRPGGANLAKLAVRFPHSMFLDQGHIRTVCTRVQFAANQCPAGAIYGHAKAVTPILDGPLAGPVYLRSSSHRLPDLVADLHGLVDIEAVARIDSVRGNLRATFTDLPDAPITKVVMSMQGGKRGLLVNSVNLCKSDPHADVHTEGQNGKQSGLHPKLRINCPRERTSR